ncbi:hypothetical protein ABC795_01675 [Blastococcus sp. HT6-30]|uniref:hypothetical protein n=1 Tax=Blastococcus sp. HT6-30 TaxID=3144843 RepID=UPI003219B96B
MIRGYDADLPAPAALRAMAPRSLLLTPELAECVRVSSDAVDDVMAVLRDRPVEETSGPTLLRER